MAYVQYGENSSTGAVSVTLTGVQNGNYLVAWVVCEDNSAAPTLSTTAGSTGTWNSRGAIVDGSEFYTGRISDAVATATGSVTIEASNQGAFQGLMVVEIDNISSYDSSATIVSDTANPRTTAAASPGSYNAMLVGFATDWTGSNTPTTNSGWTDIGTGVDSSGSDLCRAQYRLYSS